MAFDKIKTISDIPNLGDKKIVLRLDLNVPCENGKVTDDYRIARVIPTLEYIKNSGAKTVIISHIESGEKTLRPVFEYLKTQFDVSFANNLSDVRQLAEKQKNGSFILLENVRNEKGEEENSQELSKTLAQLGDVYVNEAFPVSHRPHASVVGIPKYVPGYAGFVFMTEIKKLSESLQPEKPALFILGGAKFETKLPLVSKFEKIYDYVFIGGALANDVFRAKGLSIGQSEVSETVLEFDHLLKSEKLYLPYDLIVDSGTVSSVKMLNDVSSEDKIVDAGPKTAGELFRLISKSKFVLWNGPLGLYESGFSHLTEELCRIIAESGVKSVIGGGDTVAAAQKTGLLEKFSFVSTGGGAMLEFLSKETLPGIEALIESQKNN